MTVTVTMDEAGRITLPPEVIRVFGIKPGVPLRVTATPGRLTIVKDVQEVTEGVMENGMLVLPRFGFPVDVAAAVREERDEREERRS